MSGKICRAPKLQGFKMLPLIGRCTVSDIVNWTKKLKPKPDEKKKPKPKKQKQVKTSRSEARAPRVSPHHKLCNEIVGVSPRQIQLSAEE